MMLVALFLAYTLGSISFSYWILRLVRGIDIREHGSGNAGATNTLRVGGKTLAIIVFILDVVKGMAAVWIGILLSDGNEIVPLLCGLFVVAGHNWPILMKFRGGKGVATTIGVITVLYLQAGLLAGLVAIVFIYLTKYVSLGSLVFVTALPLFIWLLQYEPLHYSLTFSLMIMLFAYIQHRANIGRMIRGEENRLGSK
ncbi:glycerol-3-phosphate 1-O-acyltransferase PlsY [Mechercharimyces sp. CAU 1602]|uniref:glycerol-3-phosphate 1-O-acyltransferase PlsY n=1 Tax=Mechercharimyces sp. CAU 1602 TaxID=2973933 RepID=UPI0021612904|nr:glycerol-3-phosphate 1-O-acyltransferase PlsY [Mechercharimyces sp. CAU 1602]MCS1350968.1 glycerol-3-phosphate 1-O-acyltransferase PlsY [Mechercharimyces sp. CAU 1602]